MATKKYSGASIEASVNEDGSGSVKVKGNLVDLMALCVHVVKSIAEKTDHKEELVKLMLVKQILS